MTPDNYLISLEAKTGKERWRKEMASFQEQYFHTMAPIVIDNHVLVGSSNDLDRPGFLQSFDPETGAAAVEVVSTPQNERRSRARHLEEPRCRAIHGGGHPWVPGAYDPETRLYIIGTGNPTPAYTSAPRGEGLTTSSPARSWPSTSTPARWRGTTRRLRTTPTIGTRRKRRCSSTVSSAAAQRKMVVTAARNGYFFVVDRVTGEHLLTSKFSDSANWARPG